MDEDGEYDYPVDFDPPTILKLVDPSEKQTVKLHVDFTEPPFEGGQGRNWTFDTLGYASGFGGIPWDILLGKGTRIEYSVNLLYRLNVEDRPRVKFDDFWFHEPSTQYFEGKVYLNQHRYVLRENEEDDGLLELSPEVGVSFMLLLIIGLTGSWLHLKRKFGFIGTRTDNESVEWEIPGSK